MRWSAPAWRVGARDDEIPRERCVASADCGGAQLEGRHCLAHLTPEDFNVVIERLQAGEPLDARATIVSTERLQALLDALRQEERPVLPIVDFSGATFTGAARFDDATFNGDTFFHGAIFHGYAGFTGATFHGYGSFQGSRFTSAADFHNTTFSGGAGFFGVTFNDTVGFNSATFGDDAIFERATFKVGVGFTGATFRGDAGFYEARLRGAGFERATFSGDAQFERATFSGHHAGFNRAAFSGDAGFDGATFRVNASFDGATFSGVVSFDEVSFAGDARFAGALFERTRELAPFVVASRLLIDDCVFLERVRLEVAARVVSARATTFAGGALLRMRWAEIALDDADFARPSTLSGATSWRTDNDLGPGCLRDNRHMVLEERPRLMTLRGAQVGQLSVSNIDLRGCRFFGAHGLESLSVEASCVWPRTPSEGRYIDRETIAEEQAWRGWNEPATRAPEWLKGRDGTEPLQATQIAALYRALRKAREEDKDQPGAGDLYYGEMEMRRHRQARDDEKRPADDPQDSARHTEDASLRHRLRGRGDTAILHAYWLVSGYGLRPVRTLAALALMLLVGGALLSWFGFHEPHSYGRSVLFAIQNALSVLRPPQDSLSAGGEIVQIFLRLFGPLLFALALLAVRARVKR